MIEKNYQPADIEGRMTRVWEESGAFRAGRPERRDARPFTIVIPPPNVTGSLHMGHALNNTLQDILCRFERMRGRDVLWQPGTDHAGIATQMVVERQLMERQEPGRREIGRARFLERVWQWKAESGDVIVNQLKRLGASCDWSRERFTMDEGLSRAVVKVFVELHREGLIYKDKRLVNWDPQLLTAISDLEVQQVEVKGSLWYLRYPLQGKSFNPDDPATFIVVATTRPETMLGDSAVAVHPDDERYADLVGKHVVLPLVGRTIPIVADDYSDPEKGSGAVKITPAHDFNDFEVGRRHNLAQISVLDQEGRLALRRQRGLSARPAGRIDAVCRGIERDRTVRGPQADRVTAAGFRLPGADRAQHPYGAAWRPLRRGDRALSDRSMVCRRQDHGAARDRRGAPRRDQLRAEELGEDLLRVDGQHPALVHLAPALVGSPDSGVVWTGRQGVCRRNRGRSGRQRARLLRRAGSHHAGAGPRDGARSRPGAKASSPATRTCSTPGSPRRCGRSRRWAGPTTKPMCRRYYPTDVLVTGFDIIFFWVARMMMMGLHFMKDVPFPTVYIHALVRDEKGAKMSKSKGNVIDPLHLIDDYGADALRFTLAAMAAMGRDIKLAPQRVEGYRNFATKLWNACRFAEMNDCAQKPGFDATKAEQTLNRWIAHETVLAAREITEAIEAYRFNDAAGSIYRFVWNVYCDWYLELAKPVLLGEDGAAKSETRAMVAWARDEILKLLHPFMPFITEELWAVTAKREALLALTPWPRKAREMTAEQLAVMSTTGPNDPLMPAGTVCARCSRFQRPRRRDRDRLGGRPRHRHSLGAGGNEHSAGDTDTSGAGGCLCRDKTARATLE